jgi:hypothetical protein
MEVMHTLRLYDAEFIAKLGALMEREQRQYRNKNEFMTALVKLGYASYTAADKAAMERDGEQGVGEQAVAGKASAASEKGVYALLTEMTEYVTLQFRILNLYHEVYQKLLSASYRMLLALSGGERVMPQKVEDGFFDDLPVRFEKIIVKLEARLGLQ